MEDSQIVALYFERSEAAIAETDRAYGAYLNQVAYNILRDADDTVEIVNDTYLGAWNAIPPTRPRSLRQFLSGITRHLSFDRLDYRMAGKRHAIVEELDECIPDSRADLEHQWEVKELAETLNTFLGTLDRKTCAVFLSRYYYAHTIPEVAANYGLSIRQTKYILEKTRRKLLEHLKREGVQL